VCCLVGSIASSFAQSVAQSVSTPDKASVAPLTAQPAEAQAARPAAQPADRPIAQSTKPAAQPNQQHAAKPVEQPVAQAAKHSEQPAAQPTAQATNPADHPAAQQAAKQNEQPVVQAAKHSGQPAAQQVEHAAKATEQTHAQPAAQQADKLTEQPVEQAGAKPAKQPVGSTVAAVTKPACPGHPDAIGTSRVITISPSEYPLLGTIQYKHTLPLKDHEVVLTFDDGPIPPYTNSILDTLAANCVKATYFLVGEMAHARPYLVRRIFNEGHSIGTHTQHHPFAMQRLSIQRVASEVNGGIASVDAALGDPKAVSPFFRIPGLGRTNAIEHFLENKGLVTWSADIDTNDWWRGTTPAALIQRTMRRLNAKGRGILLMHDIHPATALALPALLKKLKESGYHIVQVVAAGKRPKSLPEVVATPAELKVWPRVMHASAEKGSPPISALRHRVKNVIAHGHHQTRVRHRSSAATGATSTAMNERHMF
jgi:peptidoglycan/xylan/chitin deacetylase (PgdA/CDA1 family)